MTGTPAPTPDAPTTPEVVSVPIGDNTKILHGDALAALRTLPDNSIDAIVTDPPYGLSKEPDIAEVLTHWLAGDDYTHTGKGFMGNSWDSFVPGPSVWREAFRVLKPGGYAAVFASSRTIDLTTISLRLAGFEIRDTIMWHYGCLSEDSEILTPVGWLRHSDLTENSVVCAFDPDSGNLSWQKVQEILRYDYDDTAFRLLGSGTDQLLSRGHRVVVERDGTYSFAAIEDVARQREARVPVLEDVPKLRRSLSLLHEGTGSAQYDMQQDVHEEPRVGVCHGSPTKGADSDLGELCGVRHALRKQTSMGQERDRSVLLEAVHGAGERAPHVGATHSQVQGGRDTRGHGILARSDDRAPKSCLEGWCHLHTKEGQLRAGQDGSLPLGVPSHGTQERLRGRAPIDRRNSDGATLDQYGGGAPRGSRRPEQLPDEPRTVRHESGPQTVRGSRFASPTLVRVETVQYRGVMWCVRVPGGAFVARRNGKAFITGNSGFPKSLDVSKALTKAGETDLAEAYAGYGTALKPGHEPIALVRKPLIGTVAANVAEHGTGGINIDACRVKNTGTERSEGGSRDGEESAQRRYTDKGSTNFAPTPGPRGGAPEGRFPINVIFTHAADCAEVGTVSVKAPVINRFTDGAKHFRDGAGHEFVSVQTGDVDGNEQVTVFDCAEGCPVGELDSQSGILSSGKPGVYKGTPNRSAAYGAESRKAGLAMAGYGDTGGASRFFPTFRYVKKANSKERAIVWVPSPACVKAGHSPDPHNPTTPWEQAASPTETVCPVCALVWEEYKHATVKPTAVMTWLTKLVTPEGGTVLDMYAGTGSTGVAAAIEGFPVVLIERDPVHITMVVKRLTPPEQSSLFD